MKKILSLVLSFLIASSAFVVTAGAVDFANPKFEEIYNEIGWDADYSEDRVLVVIDMEKHDRNDVLTAEDFPDVALSEVRGIWVGDPDVIFIYDVGEADPKYDIDSDGKITLKDVNGMIRHIAGCAELSADELVKADINGDGKVNLRDVKCFIDHMSGRK